MPRPTEFMGSYCQSFELNSCCIIPVGQNSHNASSKINQERTWPEDCNQKWAVFEALPRSFVDNTHVARVIIKCNKIPVNRGNSNVQGELKRIRANVISNSRDFEQPKVRIIEVQNIGTSRYRYFKASGVRISWNSSYWDFELPEFGISGVRDIESKSVIWLERENEFGLN